MSQKVVPHLNELLASSPKNWGKWGPCDEVGVLNYLGETEALSGVSEVRSGKTFTLQVQIGHPHGDPAFPGPRGRAKRVNILDRGVYSGGAGTIFPGGLKKASILPIAEKGITGRGVLVDIARLRGKKWLDKGEIFSRLDLIALDELAKDCATDGQYSFLYTAAPLKVVEGTESPVNSLVIK
jgi:hypothetical protein